MSEIRRLLLEYETEEVARRASKENKLRKALVKAFSDTSDVVRERALISAIDMGDPTIITEILRGLQDDVDAVRIAAAQTLAFYHQPRTIPDLLKGLKDSNTWVRSHCARGLSKLLTGPIWARLPDEDIDKFIAGFPDMSEGNIRSFLIGIGLQTGAIDDYLKWKASDFDVEIDVSALIEELEGKPIILMEAYEEGVATEDMRMALTPARKIGLSAEVEEILSEIPEEIRATLPEEDLRRLTPETAEELVESLRPSFIEEEKPPAEEVKKPVKVRKVKKVRRKKKGPTREDLIAKIPKEVIESLPEGSLDSLELEELEALIASPDEIETAAIEGPPTKPEKKMTKKQKMIESLPSEVRESMSDDDLENLPTKELESMVASAAEIEPKVEDTRLRQLIDKFGEDKANLLINVPEELLQDIPEEQIQEMDLETLKGLTQALGPR